MVRNGEVVIVDEFTGRMMEGRRYSEGLHQAIEAKEGVKIERETVTLATVTFQNYFRMYRKLAGMTGTAATEAEELHKIYGLDVMVVPTHKSMIRRDASDMVFRTEKAKFNAVVEEIVELHGVGRPVLVGTTAVETSERLAEMLRRLGIAHEVLNAKHHEREAQIIVQAGERGAVTIATNMAGRGTDIKLGAGIAELGGLHVLGTERHEARRIDNQLRGRSGRQGDPGSSRFYVSFEDSLMKRFTPDWLPAMLGKLGMNEEEALESGMVGRAIEQAQQKVEGYHFDVRKHLVEYDDVMNRQREIIYAERAKILAGDDLHAVVESMLESEIREVVAHHCPSSEPEHWELEGLWGEIGAIVPLTQFNQEQAESGTRDELIDALLAEAQRQYREIEEAAGAETIRQIERILLLRTSDRLWVQHLTELDTFRQGVGLQAYGQQDPLVTYKREAFDMFDQLTRSIRRHVALGILHIQRRPATPAPTAATTAATPAAGGRPSPPPSPHDRRGAGRTTGPRKRRRRRGGGGAGERPQSRPQRTLPLRVGEEVQEVPRSGLTADGRESMNDLLCRDATALINGFRQDLRAGRPWYEALLDVIALWEIGEEVVDGRGYRYLLGGEAFDWLLLAERLCDAVAPDGLLPREEVEALLVAEQWPVAMDAERFAARLGPAKYRAHLNFVYGVRGGRGAATGRGGRGPERAPQRHQQPRPPHGRRRLPAHLRRLPPQPAGEPPTGPAAADHESDLPV